MSTEPDMSTVLRRGRLLIELKCWGRIDAYDGEFAERRSAGVHVEFDMISPGIRGGAGPPALQSAAGLNRAGCPTERWGQRWTSSGRRRCPGHDGSRERTLTWLRSSALGTECNSVTGAELGGRCITKWGKVIREGIRSL